MVHNIHRVVNKAIYSINTISSMNYYFDKYALLRYCLNMYLFAAENISYQDCNGVLSIQTTIVNLTTMEPHIEPTNMSVNKCAKNRNESNL